MQNQIIKTFTFLDESGVINPRVAQGLYGLGIFKHPHPIELIYKLHHIYEGLCSALKKDETRVEFSFKSTTGKSIPYDLAFLDVLLEDKDWEFNCLYFDCTDPNYHPPQTPESKWESYVAQIKMLIKNNLWPTEETILISDYQRKPRGSNKKFEYISQDIPQVYNLLPTESHGVLLVQATDMLLGGYLYSLGVGKDKEGNKTAIAKKITAIKKSVGKNRFNVWPVNWKKGCL